MPHEITILSPEGVLYKNTLFTQKHIEWFVHLVNCTVGGIHVLLCFLPVGFDFESCPEWSTCPFHPVYSLWRQASQHVSCISNIFSLYIVPNGNMLHNV